MNARWGWLAVIGVAIAWDTAAAFTNSESLTGTFRCSVAQTAWRWPVLVIALLLLTHLFLPPRMWRYDPLDRLYYRLNPATSSSPPPDHCPGHDA
jgi:hypothetical protein